MVAAMILGPDYEHDARCRRDLLFITFGPVTVIAVVLFAAWAFL